MTTAPTVQDDQARPGPGDRAGHVPGEAGLWVFILGDMVVFGLFFATILYTRGQQPELFRTSQAELHPDYAVVNTVLLLLGSFFVVKALSWVRSGRPAASYLFYATAVCAVGFAAIKSYEYYLLVDDGFTPATDDFFMYYFVFTGIHLFHMLLGALTVLTLGVMTRRANTSPGRIRVVEAGACYWHMVDGLWLLLFPLLYLVR